MRALDLMTPHPVIVHPSCTVGEASRLMAHLAIRHLVVVGDDGRLVGILSDRDLRGPLRHRDAPSPDPGSAISALMSRDVVTAVPDTERSQLVRVMSELGISAMPVLDEDRKPIGIVSYTDVLDSFAGEERASDDALEAMDRDEFVPHPRDP